ncbi:MAG TPA: ethylbenzene dehydrogenase-related protein [Gemmataceae bacterium]|nr:ethylbenzene dehydrogenase-related protein [Gemmataceae bacterium]
MSLTDPSGRQVPGRRPVAIGLLLAAGLVLAVVGIFYIWNRTADRDGQPDGGPGKEDLLVRGQQLYAVHCLQCHGEKGDGNGPAARYLYPKPRNFGEGRFRLVTTTNSIPSDEDLLRVITRGMPGSAMFPFGHLSEGDRLALVAQVRHLIQAGTEELVARESGGKADPAVVAELIAPGAPQDIPKEWPVPGPASIARGAELYRKTGCASCHGETGKGDGTQEQFDNDGMPTRPRDFTRGIFKGGRDPRQLYARISQGMAGTPMPGSSQVLKPAEICDVVNFVLSLSDPAAQNKVEHKRTTLTAKRTAASLDGDISEDAWKAAPTASIVVSPLWWRDYPEPDLQVQALHDGQTLALRLRWNDATVNDSPIRPEDFEDMAAVQLFKGDVEPFIGMGAKDHRVDMWLWRASWHNPSAQPPSLLDDYPFVSPNYGAILKKDDSGNGPPDFLTARAAGNLHTNPDRERSASNLSAEGFGSTTFRPRTAQRVTASSTRKEGGWSVILKRPLAVGTEDGIPLAAGEQYSIAFAIWDGAAGDRNGQKLISIWHDLKIE